MVSIQQAIPKTRKRRLFRRDRHQRYLAQFVQRPFYLNRTAWACFTVAPTLRRLGLRRRQFNQAFIFQRQQRLARINIAQLATDTAPIKPLAHPSR